jgi:NitT/TauT family transport system ATP-binding protein
MSWLMPVSSHDLICCAGVAKTFITESGPVPALGPTDLVLGQGRAVALVGPSGCGKSTLLLLMAGLEQPSAGTVTFKGAPHFRPHREIALVLQDYGLFPWKTVRRNVELGLRIRGESVNGDLVQGLLTELDIADKVDAYPQQLSGGQKQRVALARALVLNPSLLLLDEPFAAIDALTRERLQDLVAGAWRARGFGAVLVTHNIHEAVRLGHRICVMGPNPGTIVAALDNPGACAANYRGSREFDEKAREVRRLLEQAA